MVRVNAGANNTTLSRLRNNVLRNFIRQIVGESENSVKNEISIDKAVNCKNKTVKSSYANVVKGKRTSSVKRVINNTMKEQQPIKSAREMRRSNHYGAAKLRGRQSLSSLI